MKQLLFNQDARAKLAKGADTLAQAVISTLGPRSRNVTISRKGMTPLVAHDGVTVARAVTPLKDPFENIGAELLKEASSNTNDMVGDGTTTATLLANELIQNGLKLSNAGVNMLSGEFTKDVNPMEIKEQLEVYAKRINEMLDKKAKKLKKADYAKIAKISSASDEIADLVTQAIDKVGEGGMVMTGASESFESYVEHKDGMEFENGYLSPYFVTNPNRMTVEYADAYILLASKVIADVKDIQPILDKVHNEHGDKMPVIIIADDVVGFALQGLIQLKLKGTIPTCAVVAPEYADRRKEMLEDLAVLVGGVVYSPDKQDNLANMQIADLGRASVRITATHTLLTPKNPDKEELEERAEAIREQIKVEENKFRKERLQYRLAKITQGVAVIRVGGGSEAEINDKRLRMEDAVHAVRAAMAEGAVVGGGMALTNIAWMLEAEAKETDPILELVAKALKRPFEVLMENSGLIAQDCLASIGEDTDTYDVVNKRPVDAFKAGIIDPVKVTKLAVKHAFSVAGMFLTTNTIIVEEPETDIQKIRVVNENS